MEAATGFPWILTSPNVYSRVGFKIQDAPTSQHHRNMPWRRREYESEADCLPGSGWKWSALCFGVKPRAGFLAQEAQGVAGRRGER